MILKFFTLRFAIIIILIFARGLASTAVLTGAVIVRFWINCWNNGVAVPVINQILQLKSPVATDEAEVDIFAVVVVDFHDHVEIVKPALFSEKEERADRLRGFNVGDFGEEADFRVMSDAADKAFVVDDVYGDYTISLSSFNVPTKFTWWKGILRLTWGSRSLG